MSCGSPYSRPRAATALLAIIATGILSRTLGAQLHPLISKHLGDLLWGTLFVLLILFLFPGARLAIAALTGFAVASATELLKLHHAPWIDSLRATPVVGFLLGDRFDPGNFITYALGTILACVLSPLNQANLNQRMFPTEPPPAKVR